MACEISLPKPARSFVAMALSVLAAPVWAGPLDPPLPVREIDLMAGTSLAYEDNVFRAPDGITRPGTRRSDYVLAPYLTGRVAAPVGPVALSLSGNLSYQFHDRNPALDRERISLDGTAASRLLACAIEGSARFSRAQSDLADIVGGTSLVNVENRWVLGANALCGDDYGLRPGFGYLHTRVDNSATEREISDFRSDQYSASLGYSRPALGLISIYGSYRDGSYSNRPPLVPGGEANDRVRVWSAGLSFDRSIGTRLGGRASVGWMKVEPRLASVPGFEGTTFSAELGYRGSDRLSGTLSVARTAEQSNLLDVNYSINTRYAATARYVLNERIALSANAAHMRRRFTPTALIPSPAFVGRDRLTQLGLGASYRMGRRLNFELSGSHQHRGADNPALRYDANVAMLSVGLNL